MIVYNSDILAGMCFGATCLLEVLDCHSSRKLTYRTPLSVGTVGFLLLGAICITHPSVFEFTLKALKPAGVVLIECCNRCDAWNAS